MTENDSNNTWITTKESNFLIDKERLNEDYFCLICKNLLTNAHSGPCGCRYCYECIIDFTKGSEKYCPGETDDCHNKLLDINSNIQFEQSIDKKISKLIVKCPGKACQFENELRNFENHKQVCISREMKCLYFNIGCRQDNILQNELENHILSDTISHSNLLSECIDKFNREIRLLTENIEELKNEKKSLKFEIESIKFDRKTYEIRISEMQGKENIKNEEIEILRNENKSLRDELEMIKNEENNKNNQNKTENLACNVKSKNELEFIKNKQELMINESNQIFVENLNSLSKLNLDEEIIINSIISNKHELEIIRSENIDNRNLETFGEFLWDIENPSKIKENKYFYSESFYSHNIGYKLCFSIVIDYAYFYLDLYLLKGDYDEYLSWPCNCDVTIDIISRNCNKIRTRTKKVTHKDRIVHDGWTRPNKERNQYIEFHKLSLKKFRKVLENDELSIKCKIEMTR